LLSLFALVALVVAASGLYALLTCLISGARREWAVRLALGASETDLQRTVLWQSTRYALLGVGFGTSLFLISSRVFRVTVYNVPLWNPPLIALSGIVMVIVCILAATLQALRAGRISPTEAIRN